LPKSVKCSVCRIFHASDKNAMHCEPIEANHNQQNYGLK
jgi:hypothetical protein